MTKDFLAISDWTEQEVRDLRKHAEDRMKLHGTNAMLKVRATLVSDLASGLVTAQTQVAAAEKPLDPEESIKLEKMRGERDAATSAQAAAETELVLLRKVAEAGEGGKKAEVNVALAAYRADFPSAAGNTAERAETDGGDAGGEASGEGEQSGEASGDVDIPTGDDAGTQGDGGGGE